MALPRLSITKGRGGLGRQQPTDDGISGLITQGVAVGVTLELNKSYEIRSLRQLEGMGVDAAYDAANNADLHYHVSEFFRLSPAGVLWLRVVERTVKLADMADKANLHARQLLIDASGAIKQLALCLDPAAGYTPTLVNGLDGDVVAAIPKAQALAADEFEQHRPVIVLLAGHGLAANVAGLLDLRNLAAGEANLVAVVIGSDHTVPARATVPAIGTLLGTVSAAAVHENIGWLDKFNLASDGQFLAGGLCNGKTLADMTDQLGGLNDKGYIFPTQETGFDGFYWNDAHTCAKLSSDYAYIENVRTINKAARVIRRALLPSLKGPLLLTGAGQLRPQVAGELEGKGTTALKANMERAEEISACDVYVDPAQDVLGTSLVEVAFSIVPVGTARTIRASIGFVKSLS